MKKLYFTLFALAVFTINVNSQTTLTQSTSTTIDTGNTQSCNSGLPDLITADNIYYRVFDLAALGYSEFDVSQVTFGVEEVSDESPDFAVDVIVYGNSGGSFPSGTLNMVASVSVPLTAGDSGTLKNALISANVSDPEMVIAISIPDESGAGNSTICFLGSNDDGETNPTYISSNSCSLSTPDTMASIGFPNVHLVMEVAGTETLSLNNFEISKVSVSPNPATDIVNVNVLPSNTLKSVDVYNLRGQLVYKGLNDNSRINISNLNAGVYMLNITTDNGTTTKRIIKQ